MDIPKPPKPNGNRTPPLDPTPQPEGFTDDEINFILKAQLRVEHYRNPMVLKFIQKYLECRDIKESAEHIGITRGQAYRLRNSSDVALVIDSLTAKAALKYGLDADEIVGKVKEIMDIDPVVLENPDGTFKTHLSQIDPQYRRAIKKFKAKNIYGEDPNGMRVVVGQLIEVEFWDKMRAVELLGREKELFKERKVVEHSVSDKMKDILLERERRAEIGVTGNGRDVTPVGTGAPAQIVSGNDNSRDGKDGGT